MAAWHRATAELPRKTPYPMVSNISKKHHKKYIKKQLKLPIADCHRQSPSKHQRSQKFMVAPGSCVMSPCSHPPSYLPVVALVSPGVIVSRQPLGIKSFFFLQTRKCGGRRSGKNVLPQNWHGTKPCSSFWAFSASFLFR